MTADCSINDLCLLKDINEFSGFDGAMAQKAIKSFLTIFGIFFFFWIEDFIEINKRHHTHTKYTIYIE